MKKVIVFAIVSFFIFSAEVGSRELSRAEFIKDVNVLFLKGNYGALIRIAEGNIARRLLTKTEKKEILYLLGLSYVKTKDFYGARKAFNNILQMPGGEFREEAHIGIANSYFAEGKFSRAIEEYNGILDMYPRSERLSGVYYNLGLSYKEKKNFSKADSCFKKVNSWFDGSFEARKKVYVPARKEPRYYIIQLGAFEELKNAKKLLRRLSRKRYDAYIQQIKGKRNTLYRVRAGKFSNKHYAMRLCRKLKRHRFSPKVIVE